MLDEKSCSDRRNVSTLLVSLPTRSLYNHQGKSSHIPTWCPYTGRSGIRTHPSDMIFGRPPATKMKSHVIWYFCRYLDRGLATDGRIKNYHGQIYVTLTMSSRSTFERRLWKGRTGSIPSKATEKTRITTALTLFSVTIPVYRFIYHLQFQKQIISNIFTDCWPGYYSRHTWHRFYLLPGWSQCILRFLCNWRPKIYYPWVSRAQPEKERLSTSLSFYPRRLPAIAGVDVIIVILTY